MRAGGHDGHFLGCVGAAKAVGAWMGGQGAIVKAAAIAQSVAAPVKCEEWGEEKIGRYRWTIRVGCAEAPSDHGRAGLPLPENQGFAPFGRFGQGDLMAARVQSVEEGPQIYFIAHGPETRDDRAVLDRDLVEHDCREAGSRFRANHCRTTGEAGGAERGFDGAAFGFIDGARHQGNVSRMLAWLKPMRGVG